ncbi:MAG: isopeptide-forming domain-containing fimbrial protein, partial [Oscillospiraceae bacterium]|nr:isopeptide-forming domain-containing fimbrial protein [Oscillospiraceae bacterium]
MKNSKGIQRITCLVMAMFFALSLAVLPAVAGGGTNPKLEVTVDDPHSFNGQTLNAYMVFKLMSDSEAGEGYVYELDDAFKDFNHSMLGTQSLIDFMYENENNETALILLRNALKEFIDTKGDIPPSYTVDYSGLDGDDAAERVANFNPDDHGLYFIDGAVSLYGDPDDSSPFYALLNTDYGHGEATNSGTLNVNTKMDVPTIEKTADEHDQYIGGLVHYTLTSAVPRTAGFETFIYRISDTMSAGLTFNNDITVTVGGTEVDAGVEYTVGNVTDRGFTLEFDSDLFLDFTEGDAIIITYTATLNEDALSAPGINKNSVELEYSNDPNDDTSTSKTPPQEEEVLTFDIDIYKFNGSTPLAGAEFVLSTSANIEDTSDVINVVVDSPATSGTGATEVNNYRVAMDGETTFATITTAEGGLAHIRGLAAGTYYLHEITAPTGYTLLTAPITVAITPGENGDYIYTVGGT